jgi:hypothetical protein
MVGRIWGVKPFLYATSPCTWSPRLVRVSRDQNTRRRLSFPLFTDKRQEFLVCPIFPITSNLHEVDALLWRRTRATEWRLHRGSCGLSFFFLSDCYVLWFGLCVIVNIAFPYFLICFKLRTYLFMYYIELPHASHVLIFESTHKLLR